MEGFSNIISHTKTRATLPKCWVLIEGSGQKSMNKINKQEYQLEKLPYPPSPERRKLRRRESKATEMTATFRGVKVQGAWQVWQALDGSVSCLERASHKASLLLSKIAQFLETC